MKKNGIMKIFSFVILLIFGVQTVEAKEYSFLYRGKVHKASYEKSHWEMTDKFPAGFANILRLITKQQNRETLIRTPSGTIRLEYQYNNEKQLTGIIRKIYQGNIIENNRVEIQFKSKNIPKMIKVITDQKISQIGVTERKRQLSDTMTIIE